MRDVQVFKHCMNHPGTLTPHTIRSLASAAGTKRGVIERLLNGTQSTVDVDDAIALTDTLGVAINVLFAAPASVKTEQDGRFFLTVPSQNPHRSSRSQHPH